MIRCELQRVRTLLQQALWVCEGEEEVSLEGNQRRLGEWVGVKGWKEEKQVTYFAELPFLCQHARRHDQDLNLPGRASAASTDPWIPGCTRYLTHSADDTVKVKAGRGFSATPPEAAIGPSRSSVQFVDSPIHCRIPLVGLPWLVSPAQGYRALAGKGQNKPEHSSMAVRVMTTATLQWSRIF